MSKLIVCLGYSLQSDNSIHSVLENRLKDVVRECVKNYKPTILLMGSSRYGDLRNNKITEASVMSEYLRNKFSGEIMGIEIVTEEKTKSTIEQLCYLKDFIKKRDFNYSDLVIISSEFFNERVKLYTEFIFGTIDGIVFIGSAVPSLMVEKFKKAEADKIEMGKKWLSSFSKGDAENILKAQIEFQAGVLKGIIDQPPVS